MKRLEEYSRKVFTLRLAPAQIAFIERLKVLGKGPMTDFVRMAIGEAIDRHGPEWDRRVRDCLSTISAGMGEEPSELPPPENGHGKGVSRA